MVEYLIHLLRAAGIEAGFFRLFNYLSFRVIMAALTALLLVLLLGHRMIVALYRARFRDSGGDHRSLRTDSKRGTPTAGGLVILLGFTVSLILWGNWRNPFLLAVAAAAGYFGLVGLFDDWLKVRLKSSLYGLGEAAKTILQLAWIVPFAWWLTGAESPLPAGLRSTFIFPFARHVAWDVGTLLFAAFVSVAFFAMVNAVNITDGLDGLVTGPSVLTASLYGIFAFVLGSESLSRFLLFPRIPGANELAVCAAALVGALAGYLWFNAYPAEVMMGDTGSLAVGAVLAALAFLTRQEMLFPIVGGVFVASIATSLIQKIGDRIGRRIFLRAPVHHGFAHRGIAEPKVVIRYWIVSVILTLVAALSLKLR